MADVNKNIIQVKACSNEENIVNLEDDVRTAKNHCSNEESIPTQQCPFAHGRTTAEQHVGGNEQHVGDNSCQKENVIKWKTTIAETRPVPHRRFGAWNLFKIKQRGYLYYEGLIKKYDSSIYKLRVNSDRILVNDHLSIPVLYDPNKITKEIGFGFMNYNPLVLKNYVPAIFSNGIEHEKKKTLILEYIKFVLQQITIDKVVDLVECEFIKMPVFNALTKKQSKKLDFEDIFDKAVCNVLTKVILGNTIDHHLLEEWLDKSLEFEYGIDLTDSDEKKITAKVFEHIQASEYIKQIESIVSTTKSTHIDIVKEIIWMTCFNGFGGVKSFVISSLISFLRLPKQEKNLLQKESDHFFKLRNRSWEDLSELHYINSLFLEVARLYPPAATVWRRMSEEHTLDSTTGRYHINKGDLLCGNLYSVHRDPTIYDNPNQFSLHRPKKLVTQHNYTFGGLYEQEAKPDNFKCPGQNISEMLIKVFSMFVTRCSIVPIERPVYTGKNMGRFEGSDKPLKIKTFCYHNEDKLS